MSTPRPTPDSTRLLARMAALRAQANTDHGSRMYTETEMRQLIHNHQTGQHNPA